VVVGGQIYYLLFFIFYFLFFILSILTDRSSQPSHSLFNISSKPNNLPTMQSYSTNNNPDFSVRSSTAGIHEVSSRMTCAGALLLSNDTTVNRVLNTPEDVRACDTGKNMRNGIARNQGIIDTRCKAVRGRLYAEVQRRKVQRSIDHLDALMQKLLETQEPANEKLYDLYAERKAQLEAQL
jgi:hypothetical protein